MPTTTYTPLANATLSSSASSVTFSSISGAYRDLIFVVDNAATQLQMRIRFNSDTGFNYYSVYMSGSGTSATSGTDDSSYATMTPNLSPKMTTISIQDYSATDKHKSFLMRGDADNSATVASAHRWANTSAITSVQFYLASGTFVANSTISLYGVAA
jgi:hypothetical protein